MAIKQRPFWMAEFTTVNYVPQTEYYYALVKVTDDEIFVFSTWNGHYCCHIFRHGWKLLLSASRLAAPPVNRIFVMG